MRPHASDPTVLAMDSSRVLGFATTKLTFAGVRRRSTDGSRMPSSLPVGASRRRNAAVVLEPRHAE